MPPLFKQAILLRAFAQNFQKPLSVKLHPTHTYQNKPFVRCFPSASAAYSFPISDVAYYGHWMILFFHCNTSGFSLSSGKQWKGTSHAVAQLRWASCWYWNERTPFLWMWRTKTIFAKALELSSTVFIVAQAAFRVILHFQIRFQWICEVFSWGELPCSIPSTDKELWSLESKNSRSPENVAVCAIHPWIRFCW